MVMWSWTSSGAAALAWIAASGFAPANAQDVGDRTTDGLSREQMWTAPTAEDWAKPCLITWQRTWGDALAISKETGRAILVCTNMDGEIASEHYAGIRYRQPDVARLYEPYVTVIASVYRHNPRDYDERGQRIPCPRFGDVTCGEHIRIEPILYEKFFDGRRIAPRHVMVELDGSETYDVFYAFDTASVFDNIRDGIANRDAPPPRPFQGDRPILERVASRDIRDRKVVEAAYEAGDKAMREALIARAREHGNAEPLDLLRLAVFGFDVDLGRSAREALAQQKTMNATELIADALKVPMDTSERDGLIGALENIGESSPKAKTLAVVHRGLTRTSDSVNVGDWSQSLAGQNASDPLARSYEREARLQAQNQVLKNEDPDALAALSTAFLDRAFEAQAAAVDAPSKLEYRMLLMDARTTALRAEELGGEDWRIDAVVSLCTYYLHEDPEGVHERAEASVNSLPPGEASFHAMAILELFAKVRCQAIAAAMRQKEDWPGTWLTDVNAACAVLAQHPMGTDSQVAWHYDILIWLGGEGQAGRALSAGLHRFPASPVLHERLRMKTLQDKGVRGLQGVYARLLEQHPESGVLAWFAGYAEQVSADFFRRRGRHEDADAAYTRGIELYDRSARQDESLQDSVDHQVALCFGGQAKIALESEDNPRAVERVLASFARRPDSAAILDDLNLSTVDTAKMLLTRLKAEELSPLADALQAGLDKLRPDQLALPAYERELPPEGRGNRDGGRRGGRGGQGRRGRDG